jgi:hypothetical protein
MARHSHPPLSRPPQLRGTRWRLCRRQSSLRKVGPFLPLPVHHPFLLVSIKLLSADLRECIFFAKMRECIWQKKNKGSRWRRRDLRLGRGRLAGFRVLRGGGGVSPTLDGPYPTVAEGPGSIHGAQLLIEVITTAVRSSLA